MHRLRKESGSKAEIGRTRQTMSPNSILIGANSGSTKTENPGGRWMAKVAQITCSNPFDRRTRQIPLFPYKQTCLGVGQTLDPGRAKHRLCAGWNPKRVALELGGFISRQEKLRCLEYEFCDLRLLAVGSRRLSLHRVWRRSSRHQVSQ